MPVGEVAAVRQVQPEDGVARLQHRGVGFHVGLRSGVRLDVGVLRSEKLLGTVARQVLDDVGELAASVVALAGIAFGVLVGEHRAHGFEHGFADEVFRGDQFQSFVLAADFIVDGERPPRDRLRTADATCWLFISVSRKSLYSHSKQALGIWHLAFGGAALRLDSQIRGLSPLGSRPRVGEGKIDLGSWMKKSAAATDEAKC